MKIKQQIGSLVREYVNRNLSVRKLNALEKKVFNEGERLIPGITHDMAEVIRHKTSYEFFRAIIEDDVATVPGLQENTVVTIADFGFGTGHGCYDLARTRKSHVTGIDISPDCLEYAQRNYPASNVDYKIEDLGSYAKSMQEYDYVVSRGVFEHIQNGLNVAVSTKWRRRLMFDVPYDEPASPNPHHVLTGIREDDFSEFPNAELFYQDLSGVIYDSQHKPEKANMIMCICSHPSLPTIASKKLKFPFPVWRL